jgi:ABC-type spermidine/putrescine transport system permease subunit II
MTLLLLAVSLGISPASFALWLAHVIAVVAFVLVTFSTAFPG